MSRFTREELEKIINSNTFDELIGKYENEWFDCKGQPYLLGDNKGKREIAKDVSSFANLDGGYILIGIKTTKDVTRIGDKVDEIKPFDSSLIIKEQILKVCEDWIYPKPEGLDFLWITSNDDANKGIAVIKIPSQSETLKPFLIKNILDEEKQIEIMFGYAERVRDNSQPYSLRDIQTILRSGLNYERNMKGRFDALELLLQGVSNETNKENFQEKVDERIKIALTKTRLINERTLVLAGFVENNFKLKNFNSYDGIRRSITNLNNRLREEGWTLLDDTDLDTNLPDLIEVENYSRKLSLYRDGTTIYACTLERISPIENSSKIIPIALVEVVYQFVEFYKQIVNQIDGNFEKIHIRIELNNLDKENIETKLPLKMIFYNPFPTKVAPDKSMKREIEESKNFDTSALAYKIIKEIYEWFGFAEEQEPQHTIIDENGIGKIDIASISRS